MSTAVSVFISYSHDSDLHKQQVLGLSNRLRGDGIDCFIDQYEPAPPEGWPRKMDKGIREANYVLMVCTETYLRRLQLEEEEGKGLGVAWEGSLIYNTLYRDRTLNHKFIPVLLQPEDETHVPIILFGNSRYDLSQPRGYDHLYRHLRGELGVAAPPLGLPRFVRAIDSDDLPTVEGELFGRKDELALLDSALADTDVNIVEFVASGGTGKTKLLRHWLDNNKDKIEALIAWSFYSQGSSEDKQISATPFFIQALSELGADKGISDFNTEEEKGTYVADLLREKRCLLVLDGLEPLQQVGRGMRGELKDRAIRKMLRNLASSHTSLCIVTTRLGVHELKGRKSILHHNLQNLQPHDGVALLKSFTEPHSVYGREADLLTAVHEYGCHALALHLLGNALATYLEGDVRQRDTLTELIGDYDDVERHAFKVMQAYQQWLAGTPELKLLYLLGLFDHPVDQGVLEVVWNAEIPELTSGVPLKAWKVAQRDLTHKLRMMSAHDGRDDLFDCHPLIREYFGSQLKEQLPGVWKQAHTILYEYYKALPEQIYGKYLPDTLEEMQPLFRAVAHGVVMGDDSVFVDVFVPRIRRHNSFYSWRVLGAYADELAVLSVFFDSLWHEIRYYFPVYVRAAILSWTGMNLSALGRLPESIDAMEAGLLLNQEDRDWGNASIATHNIAEVYQVLGILDEAYEKSDLALKYVQRTQNAMWVVIVKVKLADCLFQQGLLDDGYAHYKAASVLRKQSQQEDVRLLPNCIYSDMELERLNKTSDLLGLVRVIRSFLGLVKQKVGLGLGLLDKGKCELSLAKIYLKIAIGSHRNFKYLKQCVTYADQALFTSKEANRADFLVECFLFKAKVSFSQCDFHDAKCFLCEAHDIAEPSEMRLHLTDYHLEMARLILAVEADQTQYPEATPDREQRVLPFADQDEPGIFTLQEHIATAKRLINDTGYHRRDNELNELKQQVEIC